MYHALYRKYRPQTFSDVVGQEAITAALQNQIVADKIGHAYLFTGTRGTGKTTCAKIFAKAVNCENRTGADPCGECPCCTGIENGSILDVIEIDAASNNSVDDVRDLRDETAYRPSRCRFRVYIIDEVHMLSTSAFNALLKILEEPPSHVIFILATTELHKVSATILSRCQRFDFTRIPAELIAERLLSVAAEENITLTPGAASLIARLADGALRDALSLLDTCAGMGEAVDEDLVRRMAGVADKDYLFALSDAVANGDAKELIELVSSLRNRAIEVKRLCEELVFHYRNFILALAKPDGTLLEPISPEEKQHYLQDAPQVGEAFAIEAVRRLTAALDRMGRSPDARIELELALFDLCERVGLGTAASVPPAAKAAPVQAAQASVPGQKAPAPKKQEPPPAGQSAAPVEKPAGTDVPQPAAGAAASEPAQQAPPEVPSAPQQPAQEGTPAPSDETPSIATNATAAPTTESPADTASPAPDVPQQPAAAAAAEVQTPAPASTGTPDAPAPFAPWPDVVARMAGIDRMLYSYMKDSTAYTDGRRVLINGGDMFLSFMREYDAAAEKIKTVLFEVTGTRYGIGPYTGPAQAAAQKPASAQDTLKEWEAKGIPVTYE